MIHPETRLGKALAEGRIARGIEHFAGNRAMVELAAKIGFDFNMIDMHLSYYDLETVESMVTISKLSGITSFVRAPSLDFPIIGRILNTGVDGLIVPDVTTPEMAAQVVAATKYQPQGHRMGCPMVKAADFGLMSWKEHVEKTEKETICCVLVEGKEGVNNLDEIAAVPGLDVLWLGAWDLALSLGIPGANFSHPLMEKWLHKAGEACRKNGLALYTTTAVNTDPEYVKLVESEANMICMFSDVGIFSKGCQRVLSGQGL